MVRSKRTQYCIALADMGSANPYLAAVITIFGWYGDSSLGLGRTTSISLLPAHYLTSLSRVENNVSDHAVGIISITNNQYSNDRIVDHAFQLQNDGCRSCSRTPGSYQRKEW